MYLDVELSNPHGSLFLSILKGIGGWKAVRGLGRRLSSPENCGVSRHRHMNYSGITDLRPDITWELLSLNNDLSLLQPISHKPSGRCLQNSEEKIKHEKCVVCLACVIVLAETK